jgi:hypothetical protein
MPRPRKATPITATTKNRFRIAPKGTRELIVVQEGPEQSICKWLDTGETQCISNAWLIPVE